MYESFFGLRERPFDLTPSPRVLVLTDSHREALRNLEYGIASRKGITLLIGEAGVSEPRPGGPRSRAHHRPSLHRAASESCADE